MREIKFRGWFECINGENYWAYGYLKKQSNGKWEIIPDDDSCGYTVKHPCQYTGLKDKNGKEIYEGDVVKIYSKEIGKEQYLYGIGTVIFNAFSLCIEIEGRSKSIWDLINRNFLTREFEIIGNIYENPELIKPQL